MYFYDTSDTIIQNKPKIPVPPLEIPFPPTEDNVALLQEWLLQQFADITFKVDGPLPTMHGKVHCFHLRDNAIPYAAHTPIPIPHNWKKEVELQLQKDVDMGVLRKVPVSEPTDWCMRMVVVQKKRWDS